MSYFGDQTPHQEMLDCARMVQSNYELTDDELVVILMAVICAVNDPLDEMYFALKGKTKLE